MDEEPQDARAIAPGVLDEASAVLRWPTAGRGSVFRKC